MQDLNATMFYKAKFNIHSKNTKMNDDLLWKLVINIRSWIVGKLNRNGESIIDPSVQQWTRFKFGGKLFDLGDQNRVYCESEYHEAKNKDISSVSWACKIVEKPATEVGFAPREWITEIGYQAHSPHSAVISYVVTYSDRAGFIGLCATPPALTVPNVIKALLKDPELECTVGSNQLSLAPIKLNPGDYPEFEKILLDEARELPIIYVSPKRVDEESDIGDLLVDVDMLASNVAASALVYYTDSLDFSREMHYLANSNYLCSGGAVRIYFPHIDTEHSDDSYRHRFLPARFIEANGNDQIVGIFRRALAQDVHYYESLFRINDCRELQEATQRKEKLDRIKAKSEAEIDEATREYLAESDKREAAENNIRYLKEENRGLKADIYNLQVQISAQQEHAERFAEMSSSIQAVRQIGDYPNTPELIAKYFETVYPDRITFTDRAYQSMKSCDTKKELIWEAFYNIAVHLYDFLKEKPATAYSEFKKKTGWECSRGEGAQTHADPKLMRQYVDDYLGQEINIEAHVKNGCKESDPKFVRIYFAYDPSVVDKIIIGHCGKHLDNYTTRKVR